LENIIAAMGEIIATSINAGITPAKGLIRLSIRDEYPNQGTDPLTYDQILNVINNSLVNRLKGLGITNTKEISNELVKALTKIQSLFTMSSI
jgi:hypothetical protein